MRAVFGVLGPVVAWDGAGESIALRGPRHRAVLARLIVARRRGGPPTPQVAGRGGGPAPGPRRARR
ncbi:hypothetical protein AAHZ94_24510, partial [Streptomyces sp. HSW2009]|uniref:hypothetical protein n=1 Tax=Streptomyces sp. HSW2009 TaxID=3142890 RepID=UPI0032ECA8CF